jgi:NAD(P)-dependent dehydrogenase (short-subunit alcohol dehydrogenase family)
MGQTVYKKLAQYNINVNAVGPGVTRTPFSQPLWGNPDLAKRTVSAIPKGRIAEPGCFQFHHRADHLRRWRFPGWLRRGC